MELLQIFKQEIFQPRGAQIEALYALSNSRAEGATKGLIQAATGVGKTYLAAFDSASYEKVLFVAHREEILRQAARSFYNVRKSQDYGFFDGKQKDTKSAVIFASVATLGKDEYLKESYFSRTYFDYIVIDEFHHAVNQQYQKIVSYFQPKFLLGLTATPERMDGKNIYEICDYNVPYEISLKEAIHKGMLVPFHYYGIYDETDYSQLHIVKGRYDENELTELYNKNHYRFDLIYKHYKKYHSKQSLGFCCSKQHAEIMAAEFCKRGVSSVAVYSNADGEYSEDRQNAISRLINGDIQVIFCVDMFNEGVDIASLDMVMFLRPTESPIVFLQQLGRGLRTYRGKSYLNVLDFIGNYEKAGKVIPLLTGDNHIEYTVPKKQEYYDLTFPDCCMVDFDMRLVDLFHELDKKTLSLKLRIKGEYYKIKELLDGKPPTRMELFTYMEDEIYQYAIKYPKENVFRHYFEYLYELGECSIEEKQIYNTIAREFISILETTDMQKVYKMPILYAFYNDADIRFAITENDVLVSWKRFFDIGTNWKDFSPDITYETYQSITDKQHLQKAKTMPIKFLKVSGKGFFVEKEGYALALCEEMQPLLQNTALQKHMKDILEYRTMEYYRRRYSNNP